ncbi:uncharacterized protein Dwil_GK22568 [Drosophila willistoni]|uniref:Peptidase S1 domain-containing protein n=1 Tax=Drosophila willistoni TaxID=7260 RepID=B4NF94_DROWI|nr:serine protease snake [Drosophila willistoni]EDW82961.1 uncharacterized protein Dwil_GK22568 [Drosophila willistoni]
MWAKLLITLISASAVHGQQQQQQQQQPDPAAVESCDLFKRTVFEKRVATSFFFSNAPIEYDIVDSCVGSRPLIVDGTPADPKEFPSAARLGYYNMADNKTKWFCGGTLITNRLVLTAGHCLYTDIGPVNIVRLGELEFENDKDDADPEDFGVLRTILHPDYKHPLLYNDIALIRIDRAVTFNVYKHPACLPYDDGESHESFIAIGWGQQKLAGRPSNKLLKVTLKGYGKRCLTDLESNSELPNGYDASTQLCIGSPDSKDTCNGDSGGPVLSYHNKHPCMYNVMGITSSGISCDTPNIPSVYTRVHYYMDWLKQEIAKVK